jgi:hypothetical protein
MEGMWKETILVYVKLQNRKKFRDELRKIKVAKNFG